MGIKDFINKDMGSIKGNTKNIEASKNTVQYIYSAEQAKKAGMIIATLPNGEEVVYTLKIVGAGQSNFKDAQVVKTDTEKWFPEGTTYHRIEGTSHYARGDHRTELKIERQQ